MIFTIPFNLPTNAGYSSNPSIAELVSQTIKRRANNSSNNHGVEGSNLDETLKPSNFDAELPLESSELENTVATSYRKFPRAPRSYADHFPIKIDGNTDFAIRLVGIIQLAMSYSIPEASLL